MDLACRKASRAVGALRSSSPGWPSMASVGYPGTRSGLRLGCVPAGRPGALLGSCRRSPARGSAPAGGSWPRRPSIRAPLRSGGRPRWTARYTTHGGCVGRASEGSEGDGRRSTGDERAQPWRQSLAPDRSSLIRRGGGDLAQPRPCARNPGRRGAAPVRARLRPAQSSSRSSCGS